MSKSRKDSLNAVIGLVSLIVGVAFFTISFSVKNTILFTTAMGMIFGGIILLFHGLIVMVKDRHN